MTRVEANEESGRVVAGTVEGVPAITGTYVEVERTGITRESLDEVFVETFELLAVHEIHDKPTVSTAHAQV